MKENSDNKKLLSEGVGCRHKTIVYLHGFGSSGQSGTVRFLRKQMPDCTVLAPDIPIEPSEALVFLKGFCDEHRPDLIIGTSMGAMYAMQMYDYMRICVNPALRMSELTDILKPGTFEFFQPTINGETHFTITEDTIRQFRGMEDHLFDGVNDENRQWCWGFFGDEDNIVNCREEFEKYFAPNVQTFHGGHRMNNRTIDQVILPFAEKLLERGKCLYDIGEKRMKTIDDYAEAGTHHDVMDALVLLTKAYISQCGISLGNRTVIYCAAEAWLERLERMNLPLSEMARKMALVSVMPYITSDYDPKVYDKYDISGMNELELKDACQQIIDEDLFDSDTMEVLCRGITWTCKEKF